MRKLIMAAVVALAATTAHAQKLAVNTDVAMDALMTPSLGAELVVGERTSIGLNFLFNHNPWGKEMQIFALQPEFRYYFSGRPMHHYFVGIGAVGATYDITWKGKVYDGDALGLGLTFGYVIPLGKRFNVDLHAGFGLIAYRQREYFVGDNYTTDFNFDNRPAEANADGYVLLPTRIGVSLSYILK